MLSQVAEFPYVSWFVYVYMYVCVCVCVCIYIYIYIYLYIYIGFPGSTVGKESTCNAGDPGSIPGSGRYTAEGIG